MRTPCRLLATLALVLLVALSAAAHQADRAFAVVPQAGPLKGKQVYASSYALVVGINAYPNVPRKWWLSHAVDDARSMKDVLVRHYGFPAENITLLTDGDATEKKIRSALTSFASSTRIKKDDRILVYFSGHGQTIKMPGEGAAEMGFLIPYDAEVDLADLSNPEPYLRTCLPMRQVWEYLDASPAKHVLVLADACYSGLLAKTRAFGEEALSDAQLQSLAAERTRQVITAGRKGETAVEKDALGHGAFTFSLLSLLKKGAASPGDVFTSNQLYTKLFPEVGRITEGKQTPQLSNHDTEGQFLFVATPEVQVQDGPAAADSLARAMVRTNPPGAKIFVDGREFREGKTPYTVAVGLGGDKVRTVEIAVQLDGELKTSKVALVAGRLTQLPVIEFSRAGPPLGSVVPFYNGRDFSGLTPARGNVDVLRFWHPAGDTLWCENGSAAGYLYTKEEYADFELRAEYRLTPDGLAGIALRVPPDGWPSKDGMQFQIIDDSKTTALGQGRRPLLPEERSGAIYMHAGPKASAARPPGQWNEVVIRCEGPMVLIHLNGVEVVRVNMDEYTKPTVKSPPLSQLPRRGVVGLGHNHGRIEYRNVTIRRL